MVAIVANLRILAIVSEQCLHHRYISRLDKMDVEAGGKTPLPDVLARIAGQSDQAQPWSRKSFTQMTSDVDPIHPRQ